MISRPCLAAARVPKAPAAGPGTQLQHHPAADFGTSFHRAQYGPVAVKLLFPDRQIATICDTGAFRTRTVYPPLTQYFGRPPNATPRSFSSECDHRGRRLEPLQRTPISARA